MLMSVSLEYSVWEKIQKLDPERFAELRAGFPSFGFPEDQTEKYWHGYHDPRVIDGVEAALLADYGIPFSVHRVKGLSYPEPPRVAAPPQPLITLLSTTGPSLFTVDQVRVCEDYCTDSLQAELDVGWRIIAVCPPNDCRRPTYVLGRVGAAP